MNKFLSIIFSSIVFTPSFALCQQTNTFRVCYQYQENYVPGFYNSNGSYQKGGVYTAELTVNCQTGEVYSSRPFNSENVVVQPPVYESRRRTCNPTAGALLGAGIASVIGGNTRTDSGNSSTIWGRNFSSSSWSNTYQNGYSWQMLGAGIGALLFSC